MKLVYLFSLILILVSAENAFASIRLNAVFYNANSEDIVIYTYYGDIYKVIESKKFDKFLFPFGSILTLGIKDEKKSYEAHWPPFEYWIPRYFSSEVKLVFDDDGKIYLIERDIDFKKSDPENWRDLIAVQPEGWPLEPKEQWTGAEIDNQINR